MTSGRNSNWGDLRDLNGVDDVITIEQKELEIFDREGAEIREHIEKYGLKNITGVLRKNLNGWKEKPLNIAVTGMSGKGKSSLINALRNMDEWNKGAAKVGEKECTTECRPYPHPVYNNFRLWDVPGAGTTAFPQETYLEKIEVDRYDFFMILSTERINKIELWLAQEIKRRNKRFYFVRTKIDQDMSNIQRLLKDKFEERKEFEKLKKELKDELENDFGSSQFHFFMISNHHPNKFDFPVLLHQLLIDVPNEKKIDMVFGITGMSKKIIEEKASVLSSRVWKCALMSGAAAAIPIPFVSTSIDIAMLLEEVVFYRQQFALDDESLEHLAQMVNLSLDELKEKVKFKTPEIIFTAGGLTKYMAKYATRKVAKEVAKYTVPGIGIAFSCGLSYISTMGLLQGILDMMKDDAIDVLLYVTKQELDG